MTMCRVCYWTEGLCLCLRSGRLEPTSSDSQRQSCHRSTCRGKATQFLGEVGSSGFESKGSHYTQRGLHPPLPAQTEPMQVTNCHKQLSKPIQTGPPFRGTVSAGEKNAVEPVANQNSLGFYNQLFLVPKPNNWWRPVLDLSTLNTFLNTESFKMETPETGEWVTSIDF